MNHANVLVRGHILPLVVVFDLLSISSEFPALGKFHAEPHCLPRTLAANQNDRLPSSRSTPTPIDITSIVSGKTLFGVPLARKTTTLVSKVVVLLFHQSKDYLLSRTGALRGLAPNISQSTRNLQDVNQSRPRRH